MYVRLSSIRQSENIRETCYGKLKQIALNNDCHVLFLLTEFHQRFTILNVFFYFGITFLFWDNH